MTKYLPLLLLFILSSLPLTAQHPEATEEDEDVLKNHENYTDHVYYKPLDRHLIFSFGYSQVSPLGAFKENTASVFHGVSLETDWFLDLQNIAVGIVWNFHTYDPTHSSNHSNYVYGFDQILTNLKFITNDGFLQPYIEGFVGINWLYVSEYSHLGSIFKDAIEEELNLDYEDESYSIDDAASFAYGLGAGVLLPFDFADPNGPGAYLELGVRYTFSNEITYLGNNSNYNFNKSQTNNFTFSFGFVLIF